MRPEFNKKLASEKIIDKNILNKWTKIVYQALKNLDGKEFSQIYEKLLNWYLRSLKAESTSKSKLRKKLK